MQTTIWLARHAETSDPTVFHGAESDIGLSEHGEQQAKAAAEWFRTLAPTVVVSSAMRRAVATAIPIAQAAGVPHTVEPQLHERRVGALGGVKFTLAQGPWVDTLREWQSGNTAYTTEGAESFDELRMRLVPAFERIANRWPGERIVVIAHGVVCKLLLLSLLPGWSAKRWSELGHSENLSTTELVGSPGSGWQAERILEIPEPVAVLNQLARTQNSTVRSHA